MRSSSGLTDSEWRCVIQPAMERSAPPSDSVRLPRGQPWEGSDLEDSDEGAGACATESRPETERGLS